MSAAVTTSGGSAGGVPDTMDHRAALLHFTALGSQTIVKAVQGCFSGPISKGSVEYACISHDAILLYRVHLVKSTMRLVHRTPMHAILNNIVVVPSQSSAAPDVIAVTSDSGYLSLLRYELHQGGGGGSGGTLSFSEIEAGGDEEEASERLEGEGEWRELCSSLIGKTGMRSSVAGHYLAVDSRATAIFVAAPMIEKVMFPIEVDASSSLNGLYPDVRLKSPHEAKRNTVVYSMVAVEPAAGASATNPCFAVLEEALDHPGPSSRFVTSGRSETPTDPLPPSGTRQVAFYQFDTGLHQVIRVLSVNVSPTSHYLAPCPVPRQQSNVARGGLVSGVLLCSDGEVSWLQLRDREPMTTPVCLPVRASLQAGTNGAMIVNSCFFTPHATQCFFLIQNEFGDLFKVSFGGPSHLQVEYFDTVPVSTSMHISRGGTFFVASESGAHSLYLVAREGFPREEYPSGKEQGKVAVVAPAPNRLTSHPVRRLIAVPTYKVFNSNGIEMIGNGFNDAAIFNLVLKHTSHNHAPMHDLRARVTKEGRLVFSTLSGKGCGDSRLTALAYGIEGSIVSDVTLPFVDTSSLPAAPGESVAERVAVVRMFTLKDAANPRVVVTHRNNETSVWKIGEETQETFAAFPFTRDEATIFAGCLGGPQAPCFIQVTPRGIVLTHSVGSSGGSKRWEWSPRDSTDLLGAMAMQQQGGGAGSVRGGNAQICAASANDYQVVVGFSVGGALSFTYNPSTRTLDAEGFSSDVAPATAISVPALRPSRPSEIPQITAIAHDNKKVALYITSTMQRVSKQSISCPHHVSSILLTHIVPSLSDSAGGASSTPAGLGQYIFIGCDDGRVLRVTVQNNARLSDTVEFSLGKKAPCKLIPGDGETFCYIQGEELWRCHVAPADGIPTNYPVTLPKAMKVPAIHFRTLSIDSSQQCPLLSMDGSILARIDVDGDSGSNFTALHSSLALMGKRFVTHPTVSGLCVVMETELTNKGPNNSGTYQSALQIVDLDNQTIHRQLPLPPGDSAICIAIGYIKDAGHDPIIAVGAATNFSQSPQPQCDTSMLHLYKLAPQHGDTSSQSGGAFKLEHYASRRLPCLPASVHITYAGHIAVGFSDQPGAVTQQTGTTTAEKSALANQVQEVALFQCGRRNVLFRHCIQDTLRSTIVAIDSIYSPTPYDVNATDFSAAAGQVAGDNNSAMLLACATADQSVALVRYHKTKEISMLLVVGRDSVPRMLTTVRFVDFASVVVGDRFGSVTMFRIDPKKTITDVPDRVLVADDAYVNAKADQVLSVAANMYVGQAITSLQVLEMPNTYDAVGSAVPENATVPMVLYGTILGKVGCLLPFLYEEDAVLAAYAEPIIRASWVSPLNRSLDSFYNSFYPQTGIIDGDVLQQLTVRTNTAFLSESEKVAINAQLIKVTQKTNLQSERLLNALPREFQSLEAMVARMKALTLSA